MCEHSGPEDCALQLDATGTFRCVAHVQPLPRQRDDDADLLVAEMQREVDVNLNEFSYRMEPQLLDSLALAQQVFDRAAFTGSDEQPPRRTHPHPLSKPPTPTLHSPRGATDPPPRMAW